MSKITFLELAQKILHEEKIPLAVEEMWKIAENKGYDKDVGSEGKTPWRSMGAQIYVDIRDNENSIFFQKSKRPAKFFLKELVKDGLVYLESNAKVIDTAPETKNLNEKDYHPFVTYFGTTRLKAYMKTISHSKSKKDKYAEWKHPDMIGCYYPFLEKEWEKEVIEFSEAIGEIRVKLLSFEVKKQLTFANLRESFFQSVSNSSWANEGYLVAIEIDLGDDFQEQLNRLSSSFGIGVIKIDIEDPDSSEILFPARNKEYLDWDTINYISGINIDFKGFIKSVKDAVKIQRIDVKDYDEVLSLDELRKLIKR